MKRNLQEEYKQELRRLRQRVYYRHRQGYDIELNNLLHPLTGNLEKDILYLKSLKGTRLINEGLSQNNEYSDFERYMVPPTDFTPPMDRIDPNVYSVLDQIEHIISQFPNQLTLQFDEGYIGVGKFGDRDTISTEFVGQSLWDIFNETRSKALREDRLNELSDYYTSVESRLAEILDPYQIQDTYFYESELIRDYTEMLTLLNWGEALSQEQMENLSQNYDLTDVELHEWGDEYD